MTRARTFLACLAAVTAVSALADDAPPKAVTTTAASGPAVRPNPMDFAKAFHELAGKGVTRENNAAVALFEVVGIPYKDDDKTSRAQVAKRLGIADNGKSLPDFRELKEEESTVLGGPWKAADAPNTAKRLAEWTDTLDAAAKALQRPQWFLPLAVTDDPDTPILEHPETSRYHSLGRYFIARGFYRKGEGKDLDAWRDLHSASRLGVLVGQEPSVLGMLVSVGITVQTDRATQRLAMHTTDKAVLKAMLDSVSNRPAVDMDRALEGDRLGWNGLLASVLRSPEKCEEWSNEDTEYTWYPTDDREAGMKRVLDAMRQADPDVVLRALNKNFAERNAILRMADRRKMVAASDAFDKRRAEARAALRERPPAMDASPREKTKWVADMAATEFGVPPPTRLLRNILDRAEQNRRITLVAVALEMYKLDKGQYPERLDALSPTYLPAVPTDLFNGKAMVYKICGTTYDLYSVGTDGKDDGSDLLVASETMRLQAEAKAKAAQ